MCYTNVVATRFPLTVGEWYHCYNRGVEKRKVFQSKSDYERFLFLMYVGNGSKPIQTSHLKSNRLQNAFVDTSLERDEPLTEIGTYSLMPTHSHFVLKEIRKNGIARFMQKVFTGYTMYFNKKNERTGALFAGTYKSRHLIDDRYLKMVVPYVHLNPVELIEPRWKDGKGNIVTIEKWLKQYPYSSLPDFLGVERLERKLISESIFELFDSIPSTKEMLMDAQAYYQQFAPLEYLRRRGLTSAAR